MIRLSGELVTCSYMNNLFLMDYYNYSTFNLIRLNQYAPD